MNKAKSQKIHARKRGMQRYGLQIGPKTYDLLCNKIRKGEDAVFLMRESNRVSHYAVKHDGDWIPVVYDNNRSTIVTFLPKEALSQYEVKVSI